MTIRVINVSKSFGSYRVLEKINLHAQSGEFIALLGPSGSGKTTLLRIISGLEHPDAGQIQLEGEEASNIPVQKRGVGFVFQHYALFRHMTVFENIAFGLRVLPTEKRPGEAEIKERVEKYLRFIHLEGMKNKFPSELSGGQKQRVALARILVINPKVMLLDEPFGALDAKVRKELRRWLRKLHDEMKITTIFVTHDQEEAMEIADRVAIMKDGHIVQLGTPEQLWHEPANAFVYDFLGNYNQFEGDINEVGEVHVQDAVWSAPEYARGHGFFSDLTIAKKHVQIFARPFDMEIKAVKPEDAQNYLHCIIVHINRAAPLVNIELENDNGKLIQASLSRELSENLNLNVGGAVWVRPKRFKIFDY